jgi:protease secretion system membrane fusion protein
MQTIFKEAEFDTNVQPFSNAKGERKIALAGWALILVGLGSILGWAALAPLDKGVPVTGVVNTDMSRKPVQYLNAGVVNAILVKDGDHVKQGQVLVQLDTTQLDSTFASTWIQFVTECATEARLRAERDGLHTLAFPKALSKWKGDPKVADVLSVQRELLEIHQSAFQQELDGIRATIRGYDERVKATVVSRDSKLEQLASLQSQIAATQKVVDEGFFPANRFLELQRSAHQLQGAIADDTGSIQSIREQVIEAKAHLAVRIQQYRADLDTQLADAHRDSEANANRLTAQDYDLKQAVIRSPANGTVFSTTLFSKGAVVAPGSRLMDIVPADEEFVIEGQVPVNLIDRVSEHMHVDIVFSGLNSSTTPRVPGEVVQVSADRSVDERNGNPYFKIKVRLSKEGKKMIAAENLALQSGMSVELFVKTGERTLLNYLLKPLLERTANGLTEE